MITPYAGAVPRPGPQKIPSPQINPVLQGKTTTEPDRLRQLWRIDYVKNGYYTIRPLYMMDYCLSYDSSTGGVSLRAVGDVYEVSDVTSDVKWNIYFHNGGYIFQHDDDSTRTMYPTGSGTAAGTSITTGTYAGSNSTFRWTLENGGSPMGALLHDTANGTLATTSTVKYVECGQTVSPAQLNLYPSYYADGEYCFEPNWLSSNPNVASVNIYTGQVTAHAPGTATITLSMMEDYSGEEFICRYTLVVPEEVYDQFVRIEIGEEKTPEELGLSEFIDQANPTDQTLTWNSSNEAIADVDSEGNVTAVSCGEVTITATASGSTILAYTLRSSSYATLLITSGNGLSVCSFVGYTEDDVNVKDTLSQINTNIINIEHVSFSKEEVLKYLKCSSVFYIVAHGLPYGIDVGGDVYLTSDYLNGVDLSNLELVVLLSCRTAEGKYTPSNVTNNTPANFLERLLCCGAETVVGFDREVSVDNFQEVSEAFTTLLVQERKSVFDAIDTLDGDIDNGVYPSLSYDITRYAVIGGNSNKKLVN